MSETLPFECDHENACRIKPDYECANTNCELNPMHESDCSTEAMKPKQREKICYTCKYSYFDIEKGDICHYPKSGFNHREVSATGTCSYWKDWKEEKQ